MITHYLKVASRNIFKHKGISSINVFGLAVGMACAILIILWVQVQLRYDSEQVNKDRIYRLESETWVIMPPYLRETVMVFPEVEQAIRFYFWWEPTIKYNEKIFTVMDFTWSTMRCSMSSISIFSPGTPNGPWGIHIRSC
jgi:putative ABC transport system permease protein